MLPYIEFGRESTALFNTGGHIVPIDIDPNPRLALQFVISRPEQQRNRETQLVAHQRLSHSSPRTLFINLLINNLWIIIWIIPIRKLQHAYCMNLCAPNSSGNFCMHYTILLLIITICWFIGRCGHVSEMQTGKGGDIYNGRIDALAIERCANSSSSV